MRIGVAAGLAAVLAGAGLAAGVQVPQAAPAVQQAPQEIVTRELPPSAGTLLLDTQLLFESYVRDRKAPGIVGAFGVGDFPTVFPSAGRIAAEPGAATAGPDTLWRVYSMTKPVTAMAAMALVEDGKLKLDEPLATYLPAFRGMKVLVNPDTSLETRPATRPITIRNLLTHTAGLGYNIITKGPLLKEYERLGILPAAVNVQMEAQMRPVRPRTLQEFASRVATLPLIAEPGTKWSYSIGLDVMGAVIEKVSGMPFDAFVQARLFAPLRMTSSYWTVPADQVGRLATNYAFAGSALVPFDPAATSVYLQRPSFPYGGAGLVMSARDYDRFLHMIQDDGALDGVRVLKPQTVALATSNLLPAGVTFGGVGGGTGGTNAAVPMGFGAGGSVTLADAPGGFPGKGTYGWGGAAGTIAWVDRAHRMRGNVMVNYFPADRWPLRTDVLRALGSDMQRLHGAR